MTFNEAMTGLLAGKKVRKATWPATEYIYLAGNLVLTDNNKRYQMNRVDMEANWEIASVPAAGTLLMRYGKPYRLIKETGGTYAILDEETYVEEAKGIDEKHLLSELKYRDFSIARESSKDDGGAGLNGAWKVPKRR